jgi:hypothetical protein
MEKKQTYGEWMRSNPPIPKMTAVEWLFEQFRSGALPKTELLEEAKQMEMRQHSETWDEAIDAHERRGHVIARSWCDFDDYYNEKYGGK